MQVEKSEPLRTADETKKVERLRELVLKHVDLAAIRGFL